MANFNKKEVKTEEPKDSKEQVLLTEAEFEKKQRMKNREKINRITRVFGLFAILLLIYVGIYDPLFELSFFGRIFNKEAFNFGWTQLSIEGSHGKIFDDVMEFNLWLPQVGVTVILILVTVLLVYFLTYTIVDIVDMVRSIIETSRDITRDLRGNVKDTLNIETTEKTKKKKTTKKSLFSGSDVKPDEKIVKEKEKKTRRSEADTTDLNGLSQEQLDRLLSGEPIDEVLKQEEITYDLDLN